MIISEKKLNKLIHDAVEAEVDCYKKEIQKLSKKVEERLKTETPKLDYDVISNLVRKANKNPDMKCEVKWSDIGPWIKINTAPCEDVPEIKNASYSLRPEDL